MGDEKELQVGDIVDEDVEISEEMIAELSCGKGDDDEQ